MPPGSIPNIKKINKKWEKNVLLQINSVRETVLRNPLQLTGKEQFLSVRK